jgi:hypothetical protein
MNNLSTLRRTASSFRSKAAGALAALSLIAALGGASTASADMGVAGVWFEPDVICTAQPYGSAGSLEVSSVGNVGRANVAYYMTFVSDYQGSGKWSSWVSNNVWHDASSWVGTQDFHFNRYLSASAPQRSHRVMIHYAVRTSAGWQYGGENVQNFIEVDYVHRGFAAAFGGENTTYCYV